MWNPEQKRRGQGKERLGQEELMSDGGWRRGPHHGSTSRGVSLFFFGPLPKPRAFFASKLRSDPFFSDAVTQKGGGGHYGDIGEKGA